MNSSADITIRRARPGDHAAVCGLMDPVDRLHKQHLPWLFKTPVEQPRTRAYFEHWLADEDSAVWVADAGLLVGVAFGVMRAAPPFPVFLPQRWGVLDGIAVASGWRRRGIGRRLTGAVEQWAFGRGATGLELNVYAFNAEAHAFYASLGYLPMSTRLRKPAPGT